MKKLGILVPTLVATCVTPLLSLTGCNNNKKDEIIHPTKVTIKGETTTSLRVNSAISLEAEVTPKDTTNKNVNWSSSNKDVATVNSNGYVLGLSVGTTTITVTTEDGGLKDTLNIEVTDKFIYVSQIKFDEGLSGDVSLYESLSLHPDIEPSNATNRKLEWSSSNTDVATVNEETGEIALISSGQTTIYAKSTDGSGRIALYRLDVLPGSVKGYVQDDQDKYYFESFEESGICGIGNRSIKIGDKTWDADTFNLPISFLRSTDNIPDNFLRDCVSFNSKINFHNDCEITSIGSNFLYGCETFDQDLTIQQTIESIGTDFMYGCNSMQQTLDLTNIPDYTFADYRYEGGKSFACSKRDAPAFTNGFHIICDSDMESPYRGRFKYTINEDDLVFRNILLNGEQPKPLAEDYAYCWFDGCAQMYYSDSTDPNNIELANEKYLAQGQILITSIPRENFDLPIYLGKIMWLIPGNFLANCESFNQIIELPETLTTIKSGFLQGCLSFSNVIDFTAVNVENIDIEVNMLNDVPSTNEIKFKVKPEDVDTWKEKLSEATGKDIGTGPTEELNWYIVTE